jgi:hypothetical protein
MTDFFADLEQELRGAHPRRPRAAVPVRALAVTAAVAVSLAAFAMALSAVTGTDERGVGSQPGTQEGWTGYPPMDCKDGRVVDGTIPDELVDRFAILRGDAEPVTFADDRVPFGLAEIVRQSLRPLVGPGERKYLFAVARPAGEDCEPGPPAVCLIAVESTDYACEIPAEKPVLAWLVDEAADGRRIVALLGGDEVRAAGVTAAGVEEEYELDGNIAFAQMPAGTDDVIVETFRR